MLLGIDATNWVHQLFHAQRGLNVLVTAVARLRALIDHIRPTAVVACFDCRSFRADLLPTYKAGRGEKDAALVEYLQAAPQEFGKLATVARQEGFEADDGLATLAAIGRFQRDQVVIASPDKDLRQCLAENEVTILRGFSTSRGDVGNQDWYTSARLHAEYGLRPHQWPDYQALVGDRGDSIDGCHGWGEKTAAAALARCVDIDAMLKNPFGVPCNQKQRDALLAFKDRLPIVRQLVTLRTDVAAVYDALR